MPGWAPFNVSGHLAFFVLSFHSFIKWFALWKFWLFHSMFHLCNGGLEPIPTSPVYGQVCRHAPAKRMRYFSNQKDPLSLVSTFPFCALWVSYPCVWWRNKFALSGQQSFYSKILFFVGEWILEINPIFYFIFSIGTIFYLFCFVYFSLERVKHFLYGLILCVQYFLVIYFKDLLPLIVYHWFIHLWEFYDLYFSHFSIFNIYECFL